jgi:NAD(P)-dependent dehydrogenase (short-subunit alcohol dehydrogenase family)
VITGAASGIGLATSIAFAREGAAGVALIDLSASALESALTKVKEASSRAHFIATTHILDITDEAGVEKTLDQIHTTFGRIDYAVNNAGVCKHDDGGVAQTATETWKRTLGVNLTGLFFCLRMELKIMLKQERRKISAM